MQQDDAISEEPIPLGIDDAWSEDLLILDRTAAQELELAELQELAEQGDARAQYQLGLRTIYGDGVPEDNVEAIRLVRQAAEQGLANAQIDVGWLYRDVLEDFVRAHMWFNLAAAQGHVGAMNEREQVQGRMTPQQIAQAQEMATRCVESNYSDCD